MSFDPENSPAEIGPAEVSKTQKKNEMHRLQKLGETLVALPSGKLAQLTLPESLLDAVKEAQRLKSREGLRRQMQYIGRLMRDVDPAPIQAKLDEWNGVSRALTAHMHRLERLRERLLSEPDALREFAEEFPAADLQHLRTLIRNAQRERAAAKPPKSSREIYRLLRELLPAPGAPATPDSDESENDHDDLTEHH